jgi:hypothetical protein
MTDRIRKNRDTDYYPDLKSILVYPSTCYSGVTEPAITVFAWSGQIHFQAPASYRVPLGQPCFWSPCTVNTAQGA